MEQELNQGAPSGPGSRERSRQEASPPVGFDPSRGWFCERGDFWGTVNQLCLCAKCGKGEVKRHDEPRHYSGIFTPHLHMICDECFDSLPSDSDGSGEAGETGTGSTVGDSAGRSEAEASPNAK